MGYKYKETNKDKASLKGIKLEKVCIKNIKGVKLEIYW